jgi:hypothetical protein
LVNFLSETFPENISWLTFYNIGKLSCHVKIFRSLLFKIFKNGANFPRGFQVTDRYPDGAWQVLAYIVLDNASLNVENLFQVFIQKQ